MKKTFIEWLQWVKIKEHLSAEYSINQNDATIIGTKAWCNQKPFVSHINGIPNSKEGMQLLNKMVDIAFKTK